MSGREAAYATAARPGRRLGSFGQSKRRASALRRGLSDEQAEFQLRGWLSFMRFVDLELHDPVPDAKTIWLYREQLKRAGAIDELFHRFDAVLAAKGIKEA